MRYLWTGAALAALLALSSACYGVWRYFLSEPYAYATLGAIVFAILSVLLFTAGVLSEQNRMIMKDLWRTQSLVQAATDQRPEAAENSWWEPERPRRNASTTTARDAASAAVARTSNRSPSPPGTGIEAEGKGRPP